MTVEVLYFEGCPNHEALLPRLRELASEAGAGEDIELRRVESLEAAERDRFLGSPTVRVNGADVEPGADDRTDFGLKCRIYRSNGSVSSTPPDEWIRSALEASGLAMASATKGGPTPSLSQGQRRARGIAGVGFLAVGWAVLRWPRASSVPTSIAAGWLGASHVVAAATRYYGCPELGAIPTLLLGRRVETRCGPWELLDARLGLSDPNEREGGDHAACCAV